MTLICIKKVALASVMVPLLFMNTAFSDPTPVVRNQNPLNNTPPPIPAPGTVSTGVDCINCVSTPQGANSGYPSAGTNGGFGTYNPYNQQIDDDDDQRTQPATASTAPENKDWMKCPPSVSGKDLTSWLGVLSNKTLKNKSKEVLESVKNCFPDTQPLCYSDLVYYAKNKANPYGGINSYNPYESTGGYYGSSPAEQHNQDQAHLSIKAANALPKEFLKKGKNGKDEVVIPKDIQKLAKTKGWLTASYKTRSTGGFDNPPNLFIMVIPSKNVDIILQTSPHPVASENPLNPTPKSDVSNSQNVLTIITVDKTKTPPVGQMRLLSRMDMNEAMEARYSGRPIPKESGGFTWNNEIHTQECMQCHTGPLRPISPIGYKTLNGNEQAMTPEQSKNIDAINGVLEQPVTWGTIKYGGTVVRLGPELDSQPTGWAPDDSVTRTEDFLKRCANVGSMEYYDSFNPAYKVKVTQKNPPNINYETLANAMSCVECHDNKTHGALHSGFSPSEIQFKILVDKSMPRNAVLTDDERVALVSCLSAERSAVRAEWKKRGEWMKKASCFGDQFNGKPPKIIGPTAAAKSETSNTSAK